MFEGEQGSRRRAGQGTDHHFRCTYMPSKKRMRQIERAEPGPGSRGADAPVTA
jgi:hypothetical protein